MNDKSLLRNFKIFLKYINLFWITSSLLMLSILLYILYNINQDLQKDLYNWQEMFAHNINQYEKDLGYLNKSKNNEIPEYFELNFINVLLDGTVIKASNKFLEGYNIKNSYIFKQIENLSHNNIHIMFYNGFDTGKSMVYFTKKFENRFLIRIIDPKEFFIHQHNKTIFADKNNIVLYSSDSNLIGDQLTFNIISMDGLNLFFTKKFELNSIGEFKFYVQKNITLHVYLYILFFISIILSLIFLSKKANEINKFISTLENEYSYFNFIIKDVSNEIKSDEKQNFFIVADKYTQVFNSIGEKLNNTKFEFIESKDIANIIKDFSALSIVLFKNLKDTAKESAKLDDSFEEKIKERTAELYKINEKLQDEIHNLKSSQNDNF